MTESKIVAGMRAAVAHAKGDETAATVHVVTRAAALRALAERVEAGERGIQDAITLLDLPDDVAGDLRMAGLYSRRGLDAVAALQEAVLPGWRIARLWQRRDGKFEFALEKRSSEFAAGEAPSEPAARLAACLRALAMEAERC